MHQTRLLVLFGHSFTQTSQRLSDVTMMTCPIVQMQKWRCRKVKELAKGDTASTEESQIPAKGLPLEPTLSHQALPDLRERQKQSR